MTDDYRCTAENESGRLLYSGTTKTINDAMNWVMKTHEIDPEADIKINGTKIVDNGVIIIDPCNHIDSFK
jgi:hypothetical protein